MLFVAATAIGGGIVTGLLMLPQGAAWAALAAPFGGSASALVAALVLYARRGAGWRARDERDEATDAMVSALRRLAAEGRQAEAATAAAPPLADGAPPRRGAA
ncbi:hypothetical protein OPKNFCMD_0778 [Methylobacterium crusticola]|uniref:Uncharacterized protein n=1 Tax=Methylobacterium crusticola TaxID=1697972 RepID=A0ABQ4QS91_9HYPH|nr:hypothetical protein [Methylobacterium crusticola]GJD48062.1 hypothetical protein OPKNFCMD_0778 [Methylobacterium crusticola]